MCSSFLTVLADKTAGSVDTRHSNPECTHGRRFPRLRQPFRSDSDRVLARMEVGRSDGEELLQSGRYSGTVSPYNCS